MIPLADVWCNARQLASFRTSWREQVGDESVGAKFYGPAHTNGDVLVTFERANVAPMAAAIALVLSGARPKCTR